MDTGRHVTVQRQILGRIETMTRESGTAVLLIRHHLALPTAPGASSSSPRGKVVETGPARQMVDAPRHPYTRPW